MKKNILVAISCFFLFTGFAQRRIESKTFWKLAMKSWSSGPETRSEADLAKQIAYIDYSDAFSKNDIKFNSNIVYGRSSRRYYPGEPCTIEIKKDNSITIKTANEQWSGTIENTTWGIRMKLGTVGYVFQEAVTIPVAVQQKAQYKPEQFIGKWQEVERNNGDISKGDTLYFSVENDVNFSAMLLPGTRYNKQEGVLYVTGGRGGKDIEIAANTYSVVSFNNNVLLLQEPNSGEIHTLKPVSSFNFEARRPKICDKCTVDALTETLLKKKWISWPKLYNNSFVKSDPAIYTLNFIDKISADGNNSVLTYKGKVTLGDYTYDNRLGASGTKDEDCTISFPGNNIVIRSKSFDYEGQLYEANDASLIFTDKNALIYRLYPDKSPTPENNPNNIGTNFIDFSSPGSLTHNWFAYRKNTEPGAVLKPHPGIINNLNIEKKLGLMTYEGNVFFVDENRNTYIKDCRITFSAPENSAWIKIETNDVKDKRVWNYEVFKANGKELVFGNKPVDGIQYSFY